MDQRTQSYFERVIRERHEVDSFYARTDQVHISHEGQTIWAGLVHVFKLKEHPDSSYCYTWDELNPARPSTHHRTTTILDKGEDISSKQAVEVSIYLRHKQGQGPSS